MKRKWWIIIVLPLMVLLVIYADLIVYGVRQLSGQWHIISNAQPVAEFLNNPEVSDSVKHKINLIAEVRRFAVERLTLTDTENYTELYDQQGQPVLWVVTGCAPYTFTPYQWTFPVLGSVPYKGFFKQEYAEAEAELLRNQGLDVNTRTVGGWSTLGWFKDPILSEMLKRNDGSLANLIIHELVHATIFVKDSVTFNENLASFIANKGTDIFLEETYSSDSKAYRRYYAHKSDRRAFVQHMLRGLGALDSLYRSDDFIGDRREPEKRQLIKQIMSQLDTISLNNKDYLKKIKAHTPNNAYFMSFKRYQSKQEVLDSIFIHGFDEDLVKFIHHLKSKHGISE